MLPVVLLLLFAYAVSLDAKDVRVGVVLGRPAHRHSRWPQRFRAPASWIRTSPMTGAKWPTNWSQATCAATW